jgi:hypothetical protein
MASIQLTSTADKSGPSGAVMEERIRDRLESGDLHSAVGPSVEALRANLDSALSLLATIGFPGSLYVAATALCRLRDDAAQRSAVSSAIKRTRTIAFAAAFAAEVMEDTIASYLNFRGADVCRSDADSERGIARSKARLLSKFETDCSGIPEGLIATLSIIEPDLLSIAEVRDKFLSYRARAGYDPLELDAVVASGAERDEIYRLLALDHARRGEFAASAALWVRGFGVASTVALDDLPDASRAAFRSVLSNLSVSIKSAIQAESWYTAADELVLLRRLSPDDAERLERKLADGIRQAISVSGHELDMSSGKLFDLYFQLRPHDEDVRMMFAHRLMQQREFGQAYNVLKPLDQDGANTNAPLLLSLSRSAIQTGKVMEAVAAGRRAMELDSRIAKRFLDGELSHTEYVAALIQNTPAA